MSETQNDQFVPVDDAKQSVLSLLMYYYESTVQGGFTKEQAKEVVAELIEDVHEQYMTVGDMQRTPIGTPHKHLQRAMEKVKAKAKTDTDMRSVYEDLVALEKQLPKKG